MHDIFQTRREYSLERIAQLRERIAKEAARIDLTGLTIFTVGSYGRLEASEFSDIDLFFVYDSGASRLERRTSELRLFGRLIDVVEELDFPKLSNDAQYLQSHRTTKVLKHLGSPTDDWRNYFTTRMLLLLESRPLYGTTAYDAVLADILKSYYRDYPKHEDNFRPWFLMNDIMRFWKTLLLNYENKRNTERKGDDARPRVKNFKLKFSRATTCFATVCAIGSAPGPVDEALLTEIVTATPRERLLRVCEDRSDLQQMVGEVLDDYAWFLEQTALPTDELEALFSDEPSKQAMFGRAQTYTDRLYELIRAIDKDGETKLLRALVI